MHEPIQNGIGEGGVGNTGMPIRYGNLSGNGSTAG